MPIGYVKYVDSENNTIEKKQFICLDSDPAKYTFQEIIDMSEKTILYFYDKENTLNIQDKIYNICEIEEIIKNKIAQATMKDNLGYNKEIEKLQEYLKKVQKCYFGEFLNSQMEMELQRLIEENDENISVIVKKGMKAILLRIQGKKNVEIHNIIVPGKKNLTRDDSKRRNVRSWINAARTYLSQNHPALVIPPGKFVSSGEEDLKISKK